MSVRAQVSGCCSLFVAAIALSSPKGGNSDPHYRQYPFSTPFLRFCNVVVLLPILSFSTNLRLFSSSQRHQRASVC
ncbi:hypothetical protein VNO80_01663 [Phaseolus coccineus]|uniref:Uncharacterized protein n=1 Tax=Phaseolus coccineus TaxID=3886 RepID=A0AAN9RT32_PHACN